MVFSLVTLVNNMVFKCIILFNSQFNFLPTYLPDLKLMTERSIANWVHQCVTICVYRLQQSKKNTTILKSFDFIESSNRLWLNYYQLTNISSYKMKAILIVSTLAVVAGFRATMQMKSGTK